MSILIARYSHFLCHIKRGISSSAFTETFNENEPLIVLNELRCPTCEGMCLRCTMVMTTRGDIGYVSNYEVWAR